MGDSRTWITAVVALVVGGAIGYFVAIGQVSDLEARLSTAETELVQANETAGTMAADAEALAAENQALNEQVEALEAELAARDAQIEELQGQATETPAAPAEADTATPDTDAEEGEETDAQQ